MISLNFKVPEDVVFHFLRQTLICVYAIGLYGKIALVCTVFSRSSSTPSHANFHNVSKLTFCIWTLYRWLSCFYFSIICICNYLVPCLSGDLYNCFFLRMCWVITICDFVSFFRCPLPNHVNIILMMMMMILKRKKKWTEQKRTVFCWMILKTDEQKTVLKMTLYKLWFNWSKTQKNYNGVNVMEVWKWKKSEMKLSVGNRKIEEKRKSFWQ